MIKIEIKDKHGNVLKNGDIIRYVQFKTDYQEHYDPYYREHMGTEAVIIQEEINAQKEIDEFGIFCLPIFYYEKYDIIEAYHLGRDKWEEARECLIYDLKLPASISDEDLFEFINGFEIIKPTMKIK